VHFGSDVLELPCSSEYEEAGNHAEDEYRQGRISGFKAKAPTADHCGKLSIPVNTLLFRRGRGIPD